MFREVAGVAPSVEDSVGISQVRGEVNQHRGATLR
jgi:hypothetical protein